MKAFLFAGQGQQFLHMGKDLAEKYDHVRDIYAQASHIAGYDMLNLSETELMKTEFTQPAILTLNYALSTLMGSEADVVAGLSLGEYNALIYAGVLSFEEALKIVLKRASLMANALSDTGMMALVKTDIDSVTQAIDGLNVAICNHNTPTQIVIGGYLEDLEQAKTVLKEHGIKRMIPLKVSSVSHMHLMNHASETLRDILKETEYHEPKITFINNVEAKVQTDGFVDSLAKQISHRTRLSETIELMLSMGVDEFIEIGPKGSLAKCVREHLSDVKVRSVYDVETLLEGASYES